VLGLGSSTPVVVQQWLGVPFSQPLTRTREAALAVRRLLAGEKVGGMRLARLPGGGEVPIYLAALGPKMLQAAGEVASGVIFFLVGPRALPRLLASAGTQVDSVARIPVLCGEGPEVRASARHGIVPYALVPYYARSLSGQGFGEEVAAIKAAWEAGDRAGAAGQVSDAMVDELWLVGSLAHIAERLEAFRRAGLRTPVLAFGSLATDASARRAELDRLMLELKP
jgi:alkanesulfonate monooxygenase SsuD/methylene tetrahydromethanopterin reductase-like flavin-dependent oxidoreductase (luciferase family)